MVWYFNSTSLLSPSNIFAMEGSRITITHFLVLVLANLCFVFAMQLQCFVFIISDVLQSKFTQLKIDIYNSAIEYLTSCECKGQQSPQLCKCKVSEFLWKLAKLQGKDFHDWINISKQDFGHIGTFLVCFLTLVVLLYGLWWQGVQQCRNSK